MLLIILILISVSCDSGCDWDAGAVQTGAAGGGSAVSVWSVGLMPASDWSSTSHPAAATAVA